MKKKTSILFVLVYDHHTVNSIAFKGNNTNLCLKIGQSLKDNEILLYILSDREPSSLELAIDQNNTLSQLWDTIKRELKMSGKRIFANKLHFSKFF